MIAAIYSRKSKFTAKGESIENQINLCKNYAATKGITEFIIYDKDEGFTGGNTDRPDFQRMIKDAKAKKFDMLIVYKLDRLSRSVSDFSSTYEILEKNNINFISISENFDTSTPLGKAMLYISSVFAQLERETIAERIRDNMHELAKTGRWLGGQTPLGFESEEIKYFDAEMNEKSMFKLSPVKSELEQAKLIFNKYLETGSISLVLKYLLSSNIKGKNGGEYSSTTINDILRNPVYVKSDKSVVAYYNNQDITVTGEPNGNGILIYNKKNAKNKYNDKEDWIVTVSKHKGVISSDTWIKTQIQLDKNSKKDSLRQGTGKTSLLSGVLKCGLCGAPMRITYGRHKKNGSERIYYYTCTMKCNSGKTRCDNPNVRGDQLEKIVIEHLKKLNSDIVIKELKKYKKEVEPAATTSQINNIQTDIDLKTKQMNKLLNDLSNEEDSITSKFIKTKISELGKEINELEDKKRNINIQKENNKQSIYNVDIIIEALEEFNSSIDISSEVNKRRFLLETIVDKITWNGNTYDVQVDLWGAKKK